MDAEQIRQLQPKLKRFLRQFDDCFQRKDTRGHFPVYVKGQLSDLSAKSVEPIALDGGVPPRTLQEFLSHLKWNDKRMRDRVQEIVIREHAGPNTIGIIDETSDLKKGDQTPGVQVQWCGCVGKKDNCIVTVHLAYARDDFHCLLDGDLYLPESWAENRERCRAAGIPDTVVYRSKHVIALELYDRAVANGVLFDWLTFDEWYGAKPEFLRGLCARGQSFVAEIPRNVHGWLQLPRVVTRPFHRQRGRGRKIPRLACASRRARPVEQLLKDPILRDQRWKRWRVKDGNKGPMVWEVKHVSFYPKGQGGLPGQRWHLLIARNPLDPEEIKFFISNAPAETPVGTLLLVAFSRWRVERCFEDQKGEIGLDHYEGRRYQGLQRHLVLSSVSYLFLSQVRHELRGEKPRADGLPSSHGFGGGRTFLVDGEEYSDQANPAYGYQNSKNATKKQTGAHQPHQTNAPRLGSHGHKDQNNRTLSLEYELAL